MCGIVGYVGRAEDDGALDVLMEGLARLEYRGYDSAGVALVTGDHTSTRKKSGKLANLRAELDAHPLPLSTTGIGHTRWATHGGPTDENAHPHQGGADGKLALIHNGIIENFHALKRGLLAKGTVFT
ncbi:MAG: glutamine--fructose-6-phosphate aminotransferase, partial [Terracoccus sp.]